MDGNIPSQVKDFKITKSNQTTTTMTKQQVIKATERELELTLEDAKQTQERLNSIDKEITLLRENLRYLKGDEPDLIDFIDPHDDEKTKPKSN